MLTRISFLFWLLWAVAASALSPAAAAQTPGPTPLTRIDAQGVWRWRKGGAEVALFGVNYTAPFAHAYRAHRAVDADLEKAIDQDVYHFARLGLDAFRVHVWDVEISDTLGNLVENEHLRLLDYLVAQLQARGIRVVLTPIAYWNNGYPEKDTGTGFSSIYPKGVAYRQPRAVAAQERYLTQFLNHRNQYNGQLIKHDPNILAFEVCNEPHYRPPLAPVTAFANRLVRAMRDTGCRQPIFYNLAESPSVADAILDANVDGFTFQWYPAGLVAGHGLRGNLLPHVDSYPIPYQNDPRFRRKPRLVYEFESADIMQPIMYPFMARSLRTAGFQWATQFAYDPLAIAFANTEYQTHYLNLAYTPAKALSLLIAGKAFRQVKRGQQFGAYPADSTFGATRVSYRQGLSEWNTDDEFYHTSATTTAPRRLARLRHLGGVGSSPVVSYGGTGAYFLDRLAPGVWRLEVLPDAVPLHDPFEKTSLLKPVTQILWNEQVLQVSLPDLGPAFRLRGLNAGNAAQGQARGGRLTVRPGVYLLAAPGAAPAAGQLTAASPLGVIKLGEFAAPPTSGLGPQARHTAPAQLPAGQPAQLTLRLTGAGPQDSVLLVAQHYYGQTRVLPTRPAGYATYAATVPAELLYPGLLRYWLVLRRAGQLPLTFPGAFPGQPTDWNYYPTARWEAPIVAAGAPLPLFLAATDQEQVEARALANGSWTDYVTTPAGPLALRFEPARPAAPAPPVPGAAAPVVAVVAAPAPAATLALAASAASGPSHSLRVFIGDKLSSRSAELSQFESLLLKANAAAPGARLRVLLVTRDAAAYVATIALPPAAGPALRLALADFRPAPLLLAPRPYPGFLPLFFQSSAAAPALRLADVEVLQVLVDSSGGKAVDVESVRLE
ncbi:membrane or secreted protein [uncultured Hymenobacter sp.]|uniref:membrane or secreted protein n=1 Tax=uncultured Hymenobacter sp. TaxID=170016 RepID=UPI0035CB0673